MKIVQSESTDNKGKDVGITVNNKKSVLILGEDTRSFLSVIRSLGTAGYDVHVVCYDKLSPALDSQYIVSARYYNYQAYTETQWLEKVLHLIERYQFDLVIPCDERAIYPLWSAKDRLPSTTQLAISSPMGLDILFDKWKTKVAAIECQVPVAKGRIIDLSRVSYQEIADEFGDKFVVKPLQSFEQSKLHARQKVVIVSCESEYIRLTSSKVDTQPFLIEEFFTGKGEGLSVLSIEGKVHAAFSHVRVAEPNSGGGSSYRKSTPLDNELLSATKALCQYTRLTGVAMFEYRRDECTAKWILVEVNARFWGSLPLAIYAGVDFPKLYADYLVHGDIPSQPVYEYRENVHARNLFSDIYEIKREYEDIRASGDKGKAYAGLVRRLAQIGRAFGSNETIDSFSRHDVAPFIHELKDLFSSVIGSFISSNSAVTRIRRYKAQKRIVKLFKDKKDRRIVFVCYGNIMRSPFAETYFKQLILEHHLNLETDSFGFHPHENRSSPEKAIVSARSLGYDLTEHRSKWIRQLDVRDTDIVIYFDSKNREKLFSYYDAPNAFSAADLLTNEYPKAVDIDDPYDGTNSAVMECYRMIEDSLQCLAELYKGTQK
ncbi:ATP-grasp domain-containing protein [Vibrio sp.]|nr:ATP-grasp domain-containing protein [Vibrio sp.]